MKYEKWSLGYGILKQYVRLTDWFIHKETLVTGQENIPEDKPILFAPNHQNALSDPMAILLNSNYQPVWLARADIFKNKTAALILRFLKIMPVYRIRDGKEQLAKNDKTFADSIKVLENNRALALFPEAAHSSKRQMLTHKKAVPRIVFMAEERARNNLDIHIIPTGIYYSSYWKFNRTLIVNFGKPVRVNEFLEEYKNNPNQGTAKLREELYNAILPLIINISSKEYYHDFELIRDIYGKQYLQDRGRKVNTLNRFQSDQKLMNELDKLEEIKPDQTKELVQKTRAYNKQLKKYGLRNWLLDKPASNFTMFGLNKVVLFFGLPIFLFGFLFNALPFFALDIPVRKKVKDHAFWSTFFLVPGLILFPLVYLIELACISSLLPAFWIKLAFLVAVPLAGKLAFKWYIVWRKTLGRSRLLVLSWFARPKYIKLKEQRADLYALLKQLIP